MKEMKNVPAQMANIRIHAHENVPGPPNVMEPFGKVPFGVFCKFDPRHIKILLLSTHPCSLRKMIA